MIVATLGPEPYLILERHAVRASARSGCSSVATRS